MRQLVSIIFHFSVFGVFSQTIENVDFYLENQRIVVRYDLIYPTPDTLINVSLDFRNDKGDKITPISVTGDMNKVKPGVCKRIFWDVLKDQIQLSGKYKAEVSLIKIPSVIIGTQVWLAENLNVDRFRNGDLIPEARTNEEWQKAGDNKQPAWCYYDNDPKNGATYGKLYNWYAVKDRRGLAPFGYHVPSDYEWTKLIVFLGGETNAGFSMKSESGWQFGGNGDNLSGFDGLPGGMRLNDGYFINIYTFGYWWSTTEPDFENGYSRYLFNNFSFIERDRFNKEKGMSVRCVKD